MFHNRKPPPNRPHGDTTCWSCAVAVTPENHCKVAGCEVCLRCWRKIPHAERIKIALQVLDRSPGGYLAELADALQRFEQHETDGWKSGDGE